MGVFYLVFWDMAMVTFELFSLYIYKNGGGDSARKDGRKKEREEGEGTAMSTDVK